MGTGLFQASRPRGIFRWADSSRTAYALAPVQAPVLPRLLLPRLPFYYGWVVLGCLCLAGFARQGPAVATPSGFGVPMTAEFGWAGAAVAGAVSLGGVPAALVAPPVG